MEKIAKFFEETAGAILLFFKILRENLLKTIFAVALMAAAVALLIFVEKKDAGRGIREIPAIPAAPIEPLGDEFILPPESDFDGRDFQTASEPQQIWGDDKTEKWFVPPDSQMLGELEAANNLAVTEILDGVP